MEFALSSESVLKLKADVLVLGIFKRQKYSGVLKNINASLGDALKNISEEEGFEGDFGKSVMLSRTFGKIGSKRVLLVGLGEKSEFTTNTLRKIGNLVINKIKSFSSVVAFSSEFAESSDYVSALSEGLLSGSYEFKKYKSNDSGKNKQDRSQETDKILQKISP